MFAKGSTIEHAGVWAVFMERLYQHSTRLNYAFLALGLTESVPIRIRSQFDPDPTVLRAYGQMNIQFQSYLAGYACCCATCIATHTNFTPAEVGERLLDICEDRKAWEENPNIRVLLDKAGSDDPQRLDLKRSIVRQLDHLIKLTLRAEPFWRDYPETRAHLERTMAGEHAQIVRDRALFLLTVFSTALIERFNDAPNGDAELSYLWKLLADSDDNKRRAGEEYASVLRLAMQDLLGCLEITLNFTGR